MKLQYIIFLIFNFVFIGVAQIVNRADGLPFDEHDDQLFEASTFKYVLEEVSSDIPTRYDATQPVQSLQWL